LGSEADSYVRAGEDSLRISIHSAIRTTLQACTAFGILAKRKTYDIWKRRRTRAAGELLNSLSKRDGYPEQTIETASTPMNQ